MNKAYLLAWIDIKKFPLTVSQLTIHSEDADSITRIDSSWVFTVAVGTGATYQDAHDNLIHLINELSFFKDLRPYFHSTIGKMLKDEMKDICDHLPSLSAKILSKNGK